MCPVVKRLFHLHTSTHNGLSDNHEAFDWQKNTKEMHKSMTHSNVSTQLEVSRLVKKVGGLHSA